MGVYDMYGPEEIQIKAGASAMLFYTIGDKCDLQDGAYIAYDGVVCVQGGKVVGTFPNNQLFDKWGQPIKPEEILSARNPAAKGVLFYPTYTRLSADLIYQGLRTLLENMRDVPEETATKREAKRMFAQVTEWLGYEEKAG